MSRIIGFDEEGYCKNCGTHYDNVNKIKGCERCIKFKGIVLERDSND